MSDVQTLPDYLATELLASGSLPLLTTGIVAGVPTLAQAQANGAALEALAQYTIDNDITSIEFFPGGDIYVAPQPGLESPNNYCFSLKNTPVRKVIGNGSNIVCLWDPTTGPSFNLPAMVIESFGNTDIEWDDIGVDISPRPYWSGTIAAITSTYVDITPGSGQGPLGNGKGGFLPAVLMIIDNAAEGGFTGNYGDGVTSQAISYNSGAGTYRVTYPNGWSQPSALFAVEATVVVVHIKFRCHGFVTHQDSGCRGRIRVCGTAGYGVIGDLSSNLDLDIVSVVPPNAPLSSAADLSHFSDIPGRHRIRVDANRVGDDVCNVNNLAWVITSYTANSITGTFKNPASYYDANPDASSVGDNIIATSLSTFQQTGLTVASVTGTLPTLTVTFTGNLPGDYSPTAYTLHDDTQSPSSIELWIKGQRVNGRLLVGQAHDMTIKQLDGYGAPFAHALIGFGSTVTEDGTPYRLVLESYNLNYSGYSESQPNDSVALLIYQGSLAGAPPGTTSFQGVMIKKGYISRAGYGGIAVVGASQVYFDTPVFKDVGRLRTGTPNADAADCDFWVQDCSGFFNGAAKLDAAGSMVITSSTVSMNAHSLYQVTVTGSYTPT